MPREFSIKVLREKSRCEMFRVLIVLEKRLWTVYGLRVFEVNMMSCVGLFDCCYHYFGCEVISI